MAIDGLTIIGESINDSVPSTKKLFDAGDIEGLKELAKTQDQLGAAYIDVNVGQRSAGFLAEMVKTVQGVTSKPLSIDTPDPEMAEAALKAYDPAIAGGAAPVLNSISPLRPQMFELLKIQPFRPILLVSERSDSGVGVPNHTAEQTYRTAVEMVGRAAAAGVKVDDCIIDPAIAPIGSDSEGQLHRLVGAIRAIGSDGDLRGVHMSVGLSNFTVMLPSKTQGGEPVKGPLESAFLTVAMPLGLDHVIGSVKRRYQVLDESHPAMKCVRDCLAMEPGFDVLMRVQAFYSE